MSLRAVAASTRCSSRCPPKRKTSLRGSNSAPRDSSTARSPPTRSRSHSPRRAAPSPTDHLTDAATAEAQRAAVHREAVQARDNIVAVAVSRRRVAHADRAAALQHVARARDLARTTGDALIAATVRRVAAEGVLVAWGRARLGVLVAAWQGVTEAQAA